MPLQSSSTLLLQVSEAAGKTVCAAENAVRARAVAQGPKSPETAQLCPSGVGLVVWPLQSLSTLSQTSWLACQARTADPPRPRRPARHLAGAPPARLAPQPIVHLVAAVVVQPVAPPRWTSPQPARAAAAPCAVRWHSPTPQVRPPSPSSVWSLQSLSSPSQIRRRKDLAHTAPSRQSRRSAPSRHTLASRLLHSPPQQERRRSACTAPRRSRRRSSRPRPSQSSMPASPATQACSPPSTQKLTTSCRPFPQP